MIEILSVKLYTIEDVCALLGVNRQTLNTYQIRKTTIAGKVYFAESALLDYLEGRGTNIPSREAAEYIVQYIHKAENVANTNKGTQIAKQKSNE